MIEKPPFVSGLPGKVEPPARDALCAEALIEAREFLRRRMAELEPLTVGRFDGVERIEADADAFSEFVQLEILDRLVSGILVDKVALSRASSILRGAP